MTSTLTPMLSWPSLPPFEAPQRLWVLALVPVLLIAYLIILRWRSTQGMRYTNTGVLAKVLPKQSSWRRHVAVAMTLLSLVALAFAWARPQGLEKVPRERATVVLVLDVSRSMEARDVDPNRLEAAKVAATQFLDSLPPSYNVALIALSGKPEIRSLPTIDRGAVKRAVQALELQDGTAIGDSLTAALKALQSAPPGDGEDSTPPPAAIVLLSDGTNTVGSDPVQVAQQVKQAKVKTYTIAYGTQTGYVDLDGKRERVAPDVETLRKIAQTTDGKAWSADNTKELNSVYKDIRGEVGYEEQRVEITARWAFYALAFAVVAALGAVSMAARWPS